MSGSIFYFYFLECLTTFQMNLIQTIHTLRVQNANQVLFDIPICDDPILNHYFDEYSNRLLVERRIDVLLFNISLILVKSALLIPARKYDNCLFAWHNGLLICL